MADVPADLDITTDLNNQGDAVPYHGDAVPSNRQGDVPIQLPEDKVEAPEPKLRDLLTNAFKGEGEQAQPAAPDAKQAGEAHPPASPDLVKVGDRWHNKDGTFASREQIAAHDAAQAVAEGGAAPPPQLPLWAQYMTPVEQQQFTSLPAETRTFLERTMDGVNQRAQALNEYGTIEQIIGPRRQAWANDGMPPAVALQQLLALSDFAGRDPGQFVLWFSGQHGIDLDVLLDARDQAAQPADPRYIGLQQEIVALRNTINGFTQSTAQQQQSNSLSLVQTFMDEKDASGQPSHPYFGECADMIAQHVAILRQQQPLLAERDVLQAAYDFAAYSNPNIRARMQDDQAKALKDNAAAEAARARQAGVSINGGPAADAGTQPNNANRTLRDELVHAFNQSALQ